MKKIVLLLISSIVATSIFAESAWFMAQTDKANLSSVSASSELVEAQFDGKYLYPPINVLDGDFETTWCEAEKNGSGIGESITIEFFEAVSFDEIQVVNGFASKSHPDYYKKNNRIKTLQITQVAGNHFQQKNYELIDNKPDYQSIKFELPQTAQTITLKIAGIYKGSKYDDTCLSDIRLLYKGKVIPFGNVAEIKKVQEENAKLMLKSNKNTFEKQFNALFGNSKSIWLMNDDDDFICIYKNGTSLDIYTNSSYEFLVKSDIDDPANFLKRKYKKNGISDYDAEYYHKVVFDNIKKSEKDFSKYDYALIGFYSENYDYYNRRNRTHYELGNYRINKFEIIDYVETKTSIILKLDGNNVYLNGVKYVAIPSEKILDIRYEQPSEW